ncbi:MAG TPA: hypothetical protein VFY16_13435 [Gemmatimonadaceae bacterium]|nr:hypothetical protein [Gemmatimonadaceae bacterium]
MQRAVQPPHAFGVSQTRHPIGAHEQDALRRPRRRRERHARRRALLLDGGLSAQLMVRGTKGAAETWPGLRKVPLGIVVERR